MVYIPNGNVSKMFLCGNQFAKCQIVVENSAINIR